MSFRQIVRVFASEIEEYKINVARSLGSQIRKCVSYLQLGAKEYLVVEGQVANFIYACSKLSNVGRI